MLEPKIKLLNIDCLEYMKGLPDKAFELAIVDPPYGLGESGGNISRHHSQAKYKKKDWDNATPEMDYFTELKRVSVNQIIWGANHFISKNPFDSSCWIVWDKDSFGDFADCELAYTSFKTAVRKFKFTWNGFRQGYTHDNKENRIHPTQKPVQLYKYLLTNYAKTGDKILDTHLGSGSIAIACHDMGFELTGCELDKDYYEAALNRLKIHQQQQTLFEPKQTFEFKQQSLL